jgi:GT2 family glycosyltransferase
MSQIHVQCIYAESDIAHIENILLPALKHATRRNIVFHCLNFNSTTQITNSLNLADVEVINVPNLGRPAGFAENHNHLFASYEPDGFFLLQNPDCIPAPNSIDSLIQMYENENHPAIVEGRQWPFELAKWFDPKTHETAWASAAFALVDSRFYAEVGGMDVNYFMYREDFDLSWMAWQTGWRVLYNPSAVTMHFTGSRHYPENATSLEWFFVIRNLPYLAQKFFGAKGLSAAVRFLKSRIEHWLARWALASSKQMPQPDSKRWSASPRHRMISFEVLFKSSGRPK